MSEQVARLKRDFLIASMKEQQAKLSKSARECEVAYKNPAGPMFALSKALAKVYREAAEVFDRAIKEQS